MKIKNWFVVLAVLALLIVLLSPYLKKTFSGNEVHHEHDEAAEPVVKLNKDQLEEFGIELATVKQGELARNLNLTGEIKINADKLAHIVVYSSGIVKQVYKILGDYVNKGDILAILDAPEISGMQEEYMEATARLEIAKANFEREEQLKKEDLTIQSDFLAAKDEYIKSEHFLHSSERKLKIFGFTESEIQNLENNHQREYSYYKIIAPYSGTIIEKEISTGEALEKNAQIFTIADLSTVWIDFNLYQKDLPFVKENQLIAIEVPNLKEDINAKISFVSPLLGENTRTGFARVIIPNADLKLKPGTFVTANINTGIEESDSLLIKKSAVQEIDSQKVVFVQEEAGFRAEIVNLGESDDEMVEVLSGLSPGQIYVSENSFILKAELQKDQISEGHDH